MSTAPRRFKNNRQTSEENTSRHSEITTNQQRKNKDCRYCDAEHPLRKCFRFRRLSIPERFKVVRRFGYCFNCLAHSHLVSNCRSRDRCRICLDEHHTLLHGKQGTRSKQQRKRSYTKNDKVRRSSSNTYQANGQPSSSTLSLAKGAPTIVINVTTKP